MTMTFSQLPVHAAFHTTENSLWSINGQLASVISTSVNETQILLTGPGNPIIKADTTTHTHKRFQQFSTKIIENSQIFT